MLIVLLVILFAISFLIFAEDYLGKYKWPLFIVLGLILALYAGVRPVGFDRDSETYEYVFLHPNNSEYTEPTYLLLSSLLYMIWQDVHIVFFVFGFISITLKFLAIKDLTPLLFASICIYMMNFFALHDLTQIRAGVAASFFLFSIKPLFEGRKLYAFILILIGITFHVSALVYLPVIFLGNKPFNRIWKCCLYCIAPLCIILYLLNINILLSINIPFISEKLELYQIANEFGDLEKARLLSPFPLIKMFFFLYLTYFADTIKYYVPAIFLIIKMLGVSILTYFAFASFPILSMRISELFGIVEIVAFPCIIFTIKPKYVGQSIVFVVFVIEIVYNLAINNILSFDV